MNTPSERVFFAIAIPEEIRHRLAVQLEPLVKKRLIPGRRVPIDNWHITLRFIPGVDAVAQERMLAMLDELELPEPFTLKVEGFGAFPKPTKATVAWLGVKSHGVVSELADAVDGVAEAIGIEPAERPFYPHLTLSRIRPPLDISSLTEPHRRLSVSWPVSEVTLYRSVLQEGHHARYEVIDTVPL